MNETSSKLAQCEIGWWKAHHRKDKKSFIENMTKLYQLQFGIPFKWALEATKYRLEAAKEHDIAEKLEDEGNQREADIHWKKAEDLLKKHFDILQRGK